MSYRFLPIVFLLTLLVGCTTAPKETPLTSEAGKAVRSVHVVVLAAQNEIVADIKSSQAAAAAGGGLIPALIDAAIEGNRAKKAESLIQPVRDSLIDFDLGQQLASSLSERLRQFQWLQVEDVRVRYESSPDLVGTLLAASPQTALILVEPSYHLTSDFVTLQMATSLKIYSKAHEPAASSSGSASGKPQPIYYDQATFRHDLPNRTNDKGMAAKLWAQDDGRLIKEGVDAGCEGLAAQLAEELADPYTMMGDS